MKYAESPGVASSVLIDAPTEKVWALVSDGLIDEGRIQADLLKQVPGNVGLVWAVAILV